MSKKINIVLVFLLGSALALSQYMPSAVLASSAVQNETAAKAPGEGGKDAVSTSQQPLNATRAAREEKNLQDARRQQLAERESSLAAKELELKKLSAKIEAQVKVLEDSKKRLDITQKTQTETQKKKQDEKMQKMVKLFKTMRSEQAGKMIDTLKEDLALALLSRMDTKTVAKLVPFINQPRIIKWVSANLQER